MKPISDLNSFLKGGFSLQHSWEGQGLQNVTITTHQIGELVITSGRLIACDPLIGPDTRYHFKKTVNPGRYPIFVSVADFQPANDKRIAFALVKVSDQPTVKWETALINKPDPHQIDEVTTYSVDAGTGSFADCDAAQILEDLLPKEGAFEAECHRILAEMDKNSFGKHFTAGWANMRISEATEANLVAFSSGWGDGGYASFWGFDEAGNLTSLVTDFALFPSDEWKA